MFGNYSTNNNQANEAATTRNGAENLISNYKAPKKKSFMTWSNSAGDGNSKSVLVLGETGSGKSTFINIATNYFRNGSTDDLKIMIPSDKHRRTTERDAKHSELNIGKSNQSQTGSATEYNYTIENNAMVVTLIDTPGLSDTRGADQDGKNMDIILKAAENAKDLCAIVIVINGQTPRYTLVRTF
jgi:predicted GTPase